MAARPVWKGYLKLSLVTCAVELSNAVTHSEKIHFKVINKATGNTVKRQYVDASTEKPVDSKNEVKGYKLSDGEFLLIEDKEIEKIQIESSHTLDLDGFVQKASIEQVYLDTPYYVAPADKVSEEAFAVIRKALEEKKMAGLARIVLYRRERPCVLEPLGKGMLLTTLRYDANVRKADDVFDDIKDVKTDKEMIELATHIIDKKKAKFDPSKFEDHYEQALAELIDAKKKGKKPPVTKPAERPSNVVNLFDALKKSLSEDDGKSKPREAANKNTPTKTKARAKSKPRAAARKKTKKAA
ncbi:MAG TPA: Ku protein [Rhizobiaceae bacterium]|nr:Ku protein [Rhizobiaceae bacterium]